MDIPLTVVCDDTELFCNNSYILTYNETTNVLDNTFNITRIRRLKPGYKVCYFLEKVRFLDTLF